MAGLGVERRKAIVALCLVALPSCSLFVSTDDLTGGPSTGADAAVDVQQNDGEPRDAIVEAAPTDSGADTNHVTTPPQFRAFALASNSSSQNVVSINRPPQVATGDFMIAQVYQYTYGSTAMVPAGWTKILTVDDPGPSYEIFYYEKFVAADEPDAYVFDVSTGGYASVTLVAYSGVATAKPVDASASALVSGSATYQAGTLSTDVASTLITFFAVADGQGGATWGALDGLTQRSSAGYVFEGDVVRSGVGAVGILAATCSVSSSGGVALFALSPE